MRMKTKLPFKTPTEQLLRATGDLSLQQLTAYSTLVTARKAIAAKQPQYLASKLQLRPRPEDQTLPPCNDNPPRSTTDHKIFKPEVKKWVQQNVAPKPG